MAEYNLGSNFNWADADNELKKLVQEVKDIYSNKIISDCWKRKAVAQLILEYTDYCLFSEMKKVTGLSIKKSLTDGLYNVRKNGVTFKSGTKNDCNSFLKQYYEAITKNFNQ